MATHTGEVVREVLEKWRYPSHRGWCLGVGLIFSPTQNSAFSQPWQRGVPGLETCRSATEEKKEMKNNCDKYNNKIISS